MLNISDEFSDAKISLLNQWWIFWYSYNINFPIFIGAWLFPLPFFTFSSFMAPQTSAEGLQKQSNKEARAMSCSDEPASWEIQF